MGAVNATAIPLMKPWVGSTYRSAPFNGERLLILGESEYEWKPGCLGPDVATQLISSIADGTWTHKFYSKIYHTVTGNRRTDVTPAAYHDFWHSVAFYNYVQDAVGPGPRCRPTPEMWTNGRAYFERVFADLSPQVVLALGQKLWDMLNAAGLVQRDPAGEDYIVVSKLRARAAFVCHPSSSRFAYSKWRPVVERLLGSNPAPQA